MCFMNIIKNVMFILVYLAYGPTLWWYSNLNNMNFLFSQKLNKVSPLPGFEPRTYPVASDLANHWAKMTMSDCRPFRFSKLFFFILYHNTSLSYLEYSQLWSNKSLFTLPLCLFLLSPNVSNRIVIGQLKLLT